MHRMLRSYAEQLSAPVPSASLQQLLDRAWWPQLPRNQQEAYATILTGSKPQYIAGAIVLAMSINALDCSRDMVVMLTPEVPAEVVPPAAHSPQPTA